MPQFYHRWYLRGILGAGKREAVFVAAEVGGVGADTVVVAFSRPITSPLAGYAAGVTIEKNAVGQTINTATLQADGRTVHYVLAAAAAAGDALTFAYDATPGDLETVATGNAVASIATRGVTNNLVAPVTGGALVFSTPVNSGHAVVTLRL